MTLTRNNVITLTKLTSKVTVEKGITPLMRHYTLLLVYSSVFVYTHKLLRKIPKLKRSTLTVA